MSESLQYIASSYVVKSRTVEFEKMSEYVNKLSEKISTMEKIGNRVQKERLGYLNSSNYFCNQILTEHFLFSLAYMQDLQQMQPILNDWCTVETSLRQGLEAIGEATAKETESQKKLIESQKHSLAVVCT